MSKSDDPLILKEDPVGNHQVDDEDEEVEKDIEE